jgi:hypothetical protein
VQNEISVSAKNQRMPNIRRMPAKDANDKNRQPPVTKGHKLKDAKDAKQKYFCATTVPTTLV